jgi:hypothetical protein
VDRRNHLSGDGASRPAVAVRGTRGPKATAPRQLLEVERVAATLGEQERTPRLVDRGSDQRERVLEVERREFEADGAVGSGAAL